MLNDSNRVAHYTSNHDVNSGGTPLEWFGGKTGSMAAFVSTAYMKGVPFIYNGQEVGYPDPIQFLNTSSLIDWSLNPGMVEQYKSILAFYNSSAALKKGVLASHHTSDICAFDKIFENDTVLVVVNLRNNSSSFNLPEGYANKRMYDAFTSEAIDLESGISLSAFEYSVLTDSGAVIPVAGLTLSSEAETIVAGSSKQLFATVTPPDATYKSVTWYSSDTTLAVVNEIGMVKGISPGTVLIVAGNKDQTHADTCLLTITGIAVSGIDIIQERDSVIAGNTLQPSYTIQPDDATNKSVHWQSGNTGIASVNKSGTVQGITAGTAFVYVETEDGSKKDSIEIIVIPGNEFTVYFSKPANWANSIKIYYWDPQPAGILPVVYWPGLDMTLSGGWYAYTFTGISFTNLIFNDQTKQTGNLSRNRDGWYKNDTWYNSNPDPVAIHEARANGFTIYPNPVEEGRFTVGLNPGENTAILKIVDLQGGIVFETELAGFQTTLDVPFLMNGIYLVSVTGDSCTHFQKIYIQ
ncbi:MAG: Ig-like domain-containing protein [Bacteroidales bacterium]